MADLLDDVRQMDALLCVQKVAGVSAVALWDEAQRTCRGLSVMQSVGSVECGDGQLCRD